MAAVLPMAIAMPLVAYTSLVAPTIPVASTPVMATPTVAVHTINITGIAAAVASYNDLGFLEMSRSKIFEGRGMIEEGLRSVGLSALPSAANFLFVDLGALSADEFRQKMAERSVLVRGIYRDYSNWSRVSMGRLEHVRMYVDALPGVLDEMRA